MTEPLTTETTEERIRRRLHEERGSDKPTPAAAWPEAIARVMAEEVERLRTEVLEEAKRYAKRAYRRARQDGPVRFK